MVLGNFWIGVLVGLILGGFIGFLMAALCAVAAKADRRTERYFKDGGLTDGRTGENQSQRCKSEQL